MGEFDTPSGPQPRYDSWSENRQYVLKELARLDREIKDEKETRILERKDHEERLRELENFKTRATVLAGASGASIPIIIQLAIKALTKV